MQQVNDTSVSWIGVYFPYDLNLFAGTKILPLDIPIFPSSIFFCQRHGSDHHLQQLLLFLFQGMFGHEFVCTAK